MKIGLFMMPLHPPGRVPADTYDEDLELVRRADRLGFSEIWIGEHMQLPWENMPSPELFIARALGETERIVFGTGVVLLHLHDPVQAAHRIAMLDHLAKGRFMFGIGSGGTPSDGEVLESKSDPGAMRERMTEAIDLVLRLWDEGPFDYEGRFYSIRRPRPLRDGGPLPHASLPAAAPADSGRRRQRPLLHPGAGGERGWLPLSASLVHASQLSFNWESIEAGAKRSGRTPSRPTGVSASRCTSPRRRRRPGKRLLAGAMGRDFSEYWTRLIGKGPRGLATFKFEPDTPDEDVTPEYMLDNYWIVGDPDHCIREIRKLYEQAGGFGTLLVQTDDWGNGNSQFLRSMELLATEVMPALEDLEP